MRRRMIYAILMWSHDRAERLWHWLYRVSQRYAPPVPPTSFSFELVKDEVYGFVGTGDYQNSTDQSFSRPVTAYIRLP